MSFINYLSREINCKIVYYGPGLCGKTTNLQHIYGSANGGSEVTSYEVQWDQGPEVGDWATLQVGMES